MAGAAILLRKSGIVADGGLSIYHITGIAGRAANPDVQPVPPLLVQMVNVAL
jgi:hypothetical protein